MNEDKTERARRLAAALRANLGRRKEEGRRRAAEEQRETKEPEGGGDVGERRPAGKA